NFAAASREKRAFGEEPPDRAIEADPRFSTAARKIWRMNWAASEAAASVVGAWRTRADIINRPASFGRSARPAPGSPQTPDHAGRSPVLLRAASSLSGQAGTRDS